MKIVVISATSAIAEHCARLWINRTSELILVARNQVKLERVATDLQIRNPNTKIKTHRVDFCDPEAIRQLVDQCVSEGAVDLALIAQGLLIDSPTCQNDLVLTREVLEINGISPVLFAEAFAGHMEKRGRGKIALIGSVAGDRGRSAHYTYGAAKALVEHFAAGLQHRFAGTDVKVTLIKPGPTDTPMAEQLRKKGLSIADVETVAKQIVQGIDAGRRVVYTPKKWRLLMMFARMVPFWIWKRVRV